ncbi:enoyl-CoA hydratase family protein [Streptomyces sp. JJ38]|uniref:enoyl-CoA hydratase family protein n=1 Tax=Streptomyces sp. JJ38 TaxID=2738128 RepID=UPI001C58745F|nr:enoyl-CoA hydratase family protein [Streptomyces sp. JJ38]MBW1597033.1 enoyl-CoA hydratase family protein [Streptomyces sp. JJ38]
MNARADEKDLVLSTDERGVRTLTLDSPHNRNALSLPLMTELRQALERAAADATVRAVLLTHTGNTFCSGADLSGRGGTPEDLVALLRALVELPKPVLGRVTGHVRGGGLGLLGACDISCAAAPSSSFAFSEVRIGVAPAVISLPLLPRLEPRAATRYYLTGERFDAAEAARMGLITQAADDVDAALTPVLDSLRRCSPQGLAAAKQLVTAEVLRAFDRDAGSLTALSARLFGSAEAREGMTAFLERRDPEWAQ